jgi:hypothetical protein
MVLVRNAHRFPFGVLLAAVLFLSSCSAESPKKAFLIRDGALIPSEQDGAIGDESARDADSGSAGESAIDAERESGDDAFGTGGNRAGDPCVGVEVDPEPITFTELRA